MDDRRGRPLQLLNAILNFLDGISGIRHFDCQFGSIGLSGLNLWQSTLLSFISPEIGEMDPGFQASHVAICFCAGILPDTKSGELAGLEMDSETGLLRRVGE